MREGVIWWTQRPFGAHSFRILTIAPRPYRLAGPLALAVATLAPAAPARGESALLHFLSPRIEDLDAQISTTREELASLPAAPPRPQGGTLGFHSNLYFSAGNTSAATLDLGEEHPVDTIVIIPANVGYGFKAGGSYGFPPHFRVDLSLTEDFADAHPVADYSSIAYPDPGASPAIFEAHGVPGRYLRITATQLWTLPGDDRSLLALGELQVYSGGQNIATWNPVQVTDRRDSAPLWAPEYLVDSQSSLGHATVPEPSPSNGYHSGIEDDPDHEKWVLVDLGNALPIHEIRIIPARPRDFPELQGFGFPEEFVVESSTEPDFTSPTVVFDRRGAPLPNPGDNALTIPLADVVARYVRVTATQLWRRDNDYVFALAELQVFSDGQNVALGKRVVAQDSTTDGLWAPPNLVDGFDSRHRLRDDDLAWLKGLARRHALEIDMEELVAARGALAERRTLQLIVAAAAAVLAMVIVVIALILRARLAQRRETDRLRERIAGDLHDEIGSNLGSIALLSEMASATPDDRMAEVNRIARDTGDSMRDIVWVIRTGHESLEDFVARLREVAAGMLRDVAYTFEVTPEPLPAARAALNFKRNVLLFFKEALHNIIRHASADSVTIRIALAGGRITLTVTDDGVGFDPDEAGERGGNGLHNFRARAAALAAPLRIVSAPGEGTTLTLGPARLQARRGLLGIPHLRGGRRPPPQ